MKKWLRFRVLFPFLATLPWSVGYRFADIVGRFDALRHSSRMVIEQGLKSFFPKLVNNEKLLKDILRQHFQMLARDTLDCFYMPRFTAENTGSLIKVKNISILSQAREAGCGVIMIISHYGRFFMLGPGLKFAGEEFAMLTTMVDDRHPSYDAVDRWYIAKKLQHTQMFSKGTWITTADDTRKIYRCLKGGEILLIAMDGNETTSRNRAVFPFAGGTLSLPEGIIRIASATGAKLVYAATREKGEGVEISLYPLPDDSEAALRGAVRILEQDLSLNPWQWWQWGGLDAFWKPGNASEKIQEK